MLSEVYPKFIYQIKIVQSLLLENTKFTTTITNTLQCWLVSKRRFFQKFPKLDTTGEKPAF